MSCYDCHLPYDSPGWIDAVVPNEFWLAISPTGHDGGILCVNCMAKRFARLKLRNVPLWLESGPFKHDTDYYSLLHKLFWRILSPLFMRKRLRKKHFDPDFYAFLEDQDP